MCDLISFEIVGNVRFRHCSVSDIIEEGVQNGIQPGIDIPILRFKTKHVILTGGEPLVQRSLAECAEKLRQLGYWLALETNGLIDPPQAVRRNLNTIAVSPKAMYADLYDDERMIRYADEVRVVADGDVVDFCRGIRRRITAAVYFLSPCDRNGHMNIEETIRQLGLLNQGRGKDKWLLSIQAHKLAGLR